MIVLSACYEVSCSSKRTLKRNGTISGRARVAFLEAPSKLSSGLTSVQLANQRKLKRLWPSKNPFTNSFRDRVFKNSRQNSSQTVAVMSSNKTDEKNDSGVSATESYLDSARRLTAPEPVSTTEGQVEAVEFWEKHAKLLDKAWKEYGRLHPEVYELKEEHLNPLLVQAAANPSPENLRALLSPRLHPDVPNNVYSLEVFSPEFCTLLLEEVEHLSISGLPIRRPNGMNRYGLILSDSLGFSKLLQTVVSGYIAPVAARVFPDWIEDDAEECQETYSFIVRYSMGEDVELAEHTDTSNITLNLCLGAEFTGGDLRFKGVRYTESAGQQEGVDVSHKTGQALMHLGGHIHAALPIQSGTRINLIVWATRPNGVVRIKSIDRSKSL